MKTRQHLQMNEIYANAPLAQNPYNTEYSKWMKTRGHPYANANTAKCVQAKDVLRNQMMSRDPSAPPNHHPASAPMQISNKSMKTDDNQ